VVEEQVKPGLGDAGRRREGHALLRIESPATWLEAGASSPVLVLLGFTTKLLEHYDRSIAGSDRRMDAGRTELNRKNGRMELAGPPEHLLHRFSGRDPKWI
jgi:hypothetical protein